MAVMQQNMLARETGGYRTSVEQPLRCVCETQRRIDKSLARINPKGSVRRLGFGVHLG